MLVGSISFAARNWFWPGVALFAIGLVLIAWSYSRSSLPRGYRTISFSLKALGLALLLLCLLEPMWTTTRPREGANFFAIVADNSMGLQIRDEGETQTRGEKVRALLTSDQNEWQAKLEETFMVRRYVFDSRLQSTKDFAELTLDGRASAISGALQSISERFQGQPLAGVLLLTDGNATDLPEGGLRLPALPPIYPVLLGKDGEIRDLSVARIFVSQTAFEDAPVTIQASATAKGLRGETVIAQLKLEGRTTSEQTQSIDKDSDELSFRFQVKPEKPGISFYQLALKLKNQTAAEATQHNNTRTVAVDRGKGPYRILYVSGRPNWEYKFLNRAVSEDPQVQLVALLRIARREPKFTFRGRTGESSNPLFRGFNKIDEETARYDQPVLIRLNTKDEHELRGGFPRTAEDIYGYHAVILDDLEAEFFTPDQMTLLQKFVSERGGGFLMLGGADSLQDGKYARTPIGDMLPVYMDRIPQYVPAMSTKFELTREGWLEPWVRLRSTEQEERVRLETMPRYRVLNQLREVKPGASVLAAVTDTRAGSFPALVVQRFGSGRTATLTLGDLWHSGLPNEKAQADLGKAWRQLMRWMIADVPPQLDLRAEPKPGDPDSAMLLTVRARDKKFEPLDNASVEVSVSAPNSKTNRITFTAEPSEKEPGVYHGTYVPRDPGAYVAAASISDSQGLKMGEVEAGWASEPMAQEFESLRPNRSLLEEIARKTGGEVVSMDELAGFAGSLPKRKAPVVETYSYPLWHNPSVFLIAIGCFAAEWGLRRLKGLA